MRIIIPIDVILTVLFPGPAGAFVKLAYYAITRSVVRPKKSK
jgi:hypothetical protein